MICDFLCNKSYWAKGRSKDIVVKSIENSMCFGLFDANYNQVGFARVISDYAVLRGYLMYLYWRSTEAKDWVNY